MSKLFFDHLLNFKAIDAEIKKVAKTQEEKEELWALVDEIIHHKVIGCILERLPRGDHEEFLQIYHDSPHDQILIFDYLRIKAGEDFEQLLKKELDNINSELLASIYKVS